MDPIAWLTDNKIPLGRVIGDGVDWLNDHAAFVFYAISDSLGFVIDGVTEALLWAHPLAIVALFGAIAWAIHRDWKLLALVVVSFLLVINLGYWEETMETLSLVVFATALCMLIGVPLGVAAAHRAWLYQVLRPMLDLTQTIPTFVYLIPTLILFGLGVVPGLISTVIFAVAAPVRLTYLGVTSTPRALIEAGESFGASRRQILWKVELPHALPTIMAGLTQCIMLSLSMVVIAALVGAGGLGQPVVRALNTVNIAMGFEAGLAIVLLAVVLDRLCKQPQRSTR
ncbi:choline ABC transporter permease subunit [Salinarimonas ramus]|uniref:Choline ABC transporter permease subunit n=1 Tax=Salinarimonas ramus TaxID=690164 RepID=A0A917QCP9_9HYPH|nr:choline ABC transporter permease subunit [Salinarimonas ramus]GGK43890.1 choline ABC transporter permease subunit [Salinarimonas ramus]